MVITTITTNVTTITTIKIKILTITSISIASSISAILCVPISLSRLWTKCAMCENAQKMFKSFKTCSPGDPLVRALSLSPSIFWVSWKAQAFDQSNDDFNLYLILSSQLLILGTSSVSKYHGIHIFYGQLPLDIYFI